MTVFNTQGAAVGSSQFVRARIGYCTASRVKDVLDFRKSDGKPGAARIKYMREIVAERLIDAAMDHYVSEDMEWGLLTEAEAKLEYSKHTKKSLLTPEFMPHPSIEWFGATPDALVDADGLAEFKCPRTTTYIGWKCAGIVPDDHKPQMISQMLCTGRTWCDFVAYDPRILNISARLFIRRFEATDKEMLEVETAVKQFLREADELFDCMTRLEAA